MKEKSKLQKNFLIKKVSVIGLGKLGLPMAACFASSGFRTLGIDIHEEVITKITGGKTPFFETGLEEMIGSAKKNLRVTTDIARAIDETDATFIIVPTPSDSKGAFINTYVEDVLKKLSVSLKKSSKKYHLFILNSTVMPGTTEEKFIPLIERISKRSINIDFGFCYNPEFIALGSVIKNFLNPDVLLIGESDPIVGVSVSDFYKKILRNNPSFSIMSITSAEIMKISLNAYVTMKISFGNQLAQICDAIPSADIDKITEALGKDVRIGERYLKAGTSYGGPCFPRDNRAFALFARRNGTQAPIAQAVDTINNSHNEYLFKTVLGHASKKKKILITGIAYKDNTEVIDESASVHLIEKLLKQGFKVIIHDSLATKNTYKHFGDSIEYVENIPEDKFLTIAVWVIVLPSQKTKQFIESHTFRSPITIIDCWRTIEGRNVKGEIKYVPFCASKRNE